MLMTAPRRGFRDLIEDFCATSFRSTFDSCLGVNVDDTRQRTSLYCTDNARLGIAPALELEA